MANAEIGYHLRRVVGAALLSVFCVLSCAAAPPPKLAYVVVLMRHGVRSPTWDATRLGQYSTEPWPDFGVQPGYLTPQGGKLIEILGGYYGEWLNKQGLVKAANCQDAKRVYIWADSEQRTLASGNALSHSLVTGCKLEVHSRPEGEKDPIFSGSGNPDPKLAAQAVMRRLGVDPQSLVANHRREIEALQSILTGGKSAANSLIQPGVAVGVAPGGKSVELTGPFSIASTMSENMLLEYTDGMQGSALGWGRLNARNLAQVMELHALYADLMRRTPYLAGAGASELLTRVLRSMEQAVSGKPTDAALGTPGNDALFLCGHDTNQSNVSGMLDLSWKLRDYPENDTPPGGALIFSLWHEPGPEPGSNEFTVKAQFIAQTPDQMRDLSPLSLGHPPEIADVAIPGCGDSKAGCPWPAFAEVLRKSIQSAASR